MLNAKPTRDINGTSLQGYIRIQLSELLAVLGDAHLEDGDKTTKEWAFKVGSVVFTIYDYKCYGTPVHEYDWHIGGHNRTAVEAVAKLFPNHKVEVR